MSRANPSRYDGLHRWKRKKALRDVHQYSRCPRCGELLLPPEFEVEPGSGVYRFPGGWRAWASRNLHLDHTDGSDFSYLGLSHAKCNVAARRSKQDNLNIPLERFLL